MLNQQTLLSNIGKKFGRLTVLSFAESIRAQCGTLRRMIMCLCECGSVVTLNYDRVRRGQCKSCGCLQSETTIKRNLSHGLSGEILYTIWASMKTRCTNPKSINFHNYGGRGISMCPEWSHDAQAFIEWCLMNGWKRGLQVDRINNDGNYEPSNCRIATVQENAMNRRGNAMMEYNGKLYNSHQLSALGLGIRPDLVKRRILRLGWPVEKAIWTPDKKSN